MRSEPITTLYKLINASRAEKIYEDIIIKALEKVPADMGNILIANENRFENKFSTQKMLSTKITTRQRGFTYTAFTSSQSRIITEKEMSKVHPVLTDKGYKSFAVFPVATRVERKGVCYFASKKRNFFTDQYIFFLETYCRNAYYLLENFDVFSQLQKDIDERDLFIAMAAHELKNPLTAIKMYNQIVSRQIQKNQRPDPASLLKFDKEVDRLIGLVSEYLGSRLSAMRFSEKREKCCISDIIDHAIENVRMVYPKHTFRFTNQLKYRHARIEADENKIMQVIINTLNNAAKFSSENQAITVRLRGKEREWIITIQDKGLGIKKEDLKKIFERFYKGKNHKKEGMGLGLYLAKNIMLAHNGDIRITSQYGKGTKVFLTLPKVIE